MGTQVQSDDGWRGLCPLHLAISKQWKVHYFSADMRDRAEHREEEAKFLGDMPGVVGSKAMAALERPLAVMRLDYGGVDFASITVARFYSLKPARPW